MMLPQGQSFNPDEEARQEALREAFAIDLQVDPLLCNTTTFTL
jgi:hypothetical protein